MPAAPQVFDRHIWCQRRSRAARQGGQHDFLFREVAARLGARLDIVKKDFPRVLELGTATGAMAEVLSGRAGTIDVVRADYVDGANVDVVLESETLDFSPQSFDAVISCLDLHWINDLPGVLAQVHRILKPDGLFLAALLGGETLHELRTAFLQAEMNATGGGSLRVSPFADVRDIGGLLQRAGLALPVADTEKIVVDYSDPLRLMKDLRGMGAANVAAARLKHMSRRDVVFGAAKAYQEMFGDDAGRIPATFEVIYAIGWVPHESQQKPLMRGSGTVSLADVLKPVPPSKDN
ncbi:MAG: methyltransferase domain-containing protein [Alphaproteobacteria bacterium]|nr:methyltransferase domain-containing protein [Alphaproteobacteria bacterium]